MKFNTIPILDKAKHLKDELFGMPDKQSEQNVSSSIDSTQDTDKIWQALQTLLSNDGVEFLKQHGWHIDAKSKAIRPPEASQTNKEEHKNLFSTTSEALKNLSHSLTDHMSLQKNYQYLAEQTFQSIEDEALSQLQTINHHDIILNISKRILINLMMETERLNIIDSLKNHSLIPVNTTNFQYADFNDSNSLMQHQHYMLSNRTILDVYNILEESGIRKTFYAFLCEEVEESIVAAQLSDHMNLSLNPDTKRFEIAIDSKYSLLNAAQNLTEKRKNKQSSGSHHTRLRHIFARLKGYI